MPTLKTKRECWFRDTKRLQIKSHKSNIIALARRDIYPELIIIIVN